MHIYLCKYPNHSEGGYYYYIGKRELSPEKCKYYFGGGKFCEGYEKKYGKEFIRKNVQKIVLMSNIPSKESLSYWEKVHIRSHREQYRDRVMNLAKGGLGGGRTGPHTEETKRKIGEASKRRNHSDEAKRKIAKALKGKKHSEETRRKIAEGNKGKKKSEETKRKIGKANGGKNNPNYNVNSVRQVHKRICEAGEIKVTRGAFNYVLKSPKHQKHDEFTKLYNKYSVCEDCGERSCICGLEWD